MSLNASSTQLSTCRVILTLMHVRRCGLSLVALVSSLAGCVDVPERAGVSGAERLAEADVHFAAGRFGEALGLYEAFLDGDPADVPYGRLHRTYLALGLSTQARELKLQSRAAGLPEEAPGAWHCDMGMIAIQAGDTAALAVHTDSASWILGLQPESDPRLLECVAFLEVFARRYNDAKEHLEVLSGLDASEVPPPNLAFLYLREGRKDEADRILSEAEQSAADAAAADPDDPEPHFELAEFATMRGDIPTATAALSEAMDRGLGRSWWVYQLFDPEAMPDPVFEPLYGHPDFERMRTGVVNERLRMQRTGLNLPPTTDRP